MEAEGAARGRFGLTPAAFWLLCRRGQSNSPRRAKYPHLFVPPAVEIAQGAAGADSPCQGEMSRRNKRGRDKLLPRRPQGAALRAGRPEAAPYEALSQPVCRGAVSSTPP